MKIAVVCGGLSNERDVSITSGTCVARALRERGHKVVLVDLYYGYSGSYDDPAELFEREQEDVKYSVKEETPDIARILAEGDGSRIGKNVIEICKAADISFLATVKTVSFRPPSTCTALNTPAAATSAAQ